MVLAVADAANLLVGIPASRPAASASASLHLQRSHFAIRSIWANYSDLTPNGGLYGKSFQHDFSFCRRDAKLRLQYRFCSRCSYCIHSRSNAVKRELELSKPGSVTDSYPFDKLRDLQRAVEECALQNAVHFMVFSMSSFPTNNP